MASFSSCNDHKLNSHLTCFQRGFILQLHTVAQLVEHCTGIVKVMGLNPVGASEFFLGFLCNCLSYFTTAKITFSSRSLSYFRTLRITFICILYPQCTHIIFIILTLYMYILQLITFFYFRVVCSPDVCMGCLLQTAVKYSPHLDWIIAHIG